ncbi:hypothetical protein K1T71_003129 [Dendrolimus kikuchii]|uniref:Uncharacterized protein n=1 Tax=Dendrolimus kikuchii TaxID=765133 RepID=A0ACC1DBB7_9NEOP|nr:hypothetical protein K1T71_003129 [Dendrolimus kikuchii]
MSNGNVSESEEEMLVYAEFENCVDIEKYRNIHVLGINEKSPIIQMDNTIFTGKYENALGTYMFFEDDPMPVTKDPLFDKLAEKNLKYKCKTKKVLYMQHAHITPKEGKVVQDQQDKVHEIEDEMELVNFKTMQDALDKFKNNWDTFTNATSAISTRNVNDDPMDANIS